MANGQLFYGSLCVTDILEKLKQRHSAFQKGQNGKIYVNIATWLNDEVDKYGNCMSIQLQSQKEKKDTEPKMYIGNCKKSEKKDPGPITNADIATLPSENYADDLPF